MRPPRTKLQRLAAQRSREIRTVVAADIRSAREDAGLSLRRLADAAGVSHSTLRGLEHGLHDPTTEIMTRVATVLGMSPSVRLCPGTGPLIGDHIQGAMLSALVGILHERWRPRPRSRCTDRSAASSTWSSMTI